MHVYAPAGEAQCCCCYSSAPASTSVEHTGSQYLVHTSNSGQMMYGWSSMVMLNASLVADATAVAARPLRRAVFAVADLCRTAISTTTAAAALVCCCLLLDV